MSRVDFAYGASHGIDMACHTTARHVAAGRTMYVYCTNAKRLARFNLRLWEFDATSFISHCMINDPLAEHAKVLLMHKPSDLELVQNADWLLNLDIDCPPNPSKFNRILEIVSNHEQDKQYARNRWQQYKSLGFDLKGHKLKQDQ